MKDVRSIQILFWATVIMMISLGLLSPVVACVIILSPIAVLLPASDIEFAIINLSTEAFNNEHRLGQILFLIGSPIITYSICWNFLGHLFNPVKPFEFKKFFSDSTRLPRHKYYSVYSINTTSFSEYFRRITFKSRLFFALMFFFGGIYFIELGLRPFFPAVSQMSIGHGLLIVSAPILPLLFLHLFSVVLRARIFRIVNAIIYTLTSVMAFALICIMAIDFLAPQYDVLLMLTIIFALIYVVGIGFCVIFILPTTVLIKNSIYTRSNRLNQLMYDLFTQTYIMGQASDEKVASRLKNYLGFGDLRDRVLFIGGMILIVIFFFFIAVAVAPMFEEFMAAIPEMIQTGPAPLNKDIETLMPMMVWFGGFSLLSALVAFLGHKLLFEWESRRMYVLSEEYKEDPKREVILLRSSRQDNFRWEGKRSFKRFGFISFDKYLEKRTSRVGPLVAFGAKKNLSYFDSRPRHPVGVIRYDAGAMWEDYVLGRMKETPLILFMIGDETPGVRIELEQLVRQKLFWKTIFVVPPVSAQKRCEYWSVVGGYFPELGEYFQKIGSVAVSQVRSVCFSMGRWIVILNKRTNAYAYDVVLEVALSLFSDYDNSCEARRLRAYLRSKKLRQRYDRQSGEKASRSNILE